MSNQARYTFDPEVYWKILQPEDNAINESGMTIDCIPFREPTIPADEYKYLTDFLSSIAYFFQFENLMVS